MTKNVTLHPPMMPNFISYSTGETAQRQDGFDPDKNKLAVESLSKQEAEEYAELMKITFMQHWTAKQK